MPSRGSTNSIEKPIEDHSHDSDVELTASGELKEWKVLAKIDYRVVPVLCILYLLAFLDR